MTIREFLTQCETSFAGRVRLMPAQEAVYVEKLSTFSPDQLSAIYNKVLEITEHFPKIKNIYDAARDLGYLQTESDVYKPHQWKTTDCHLCRGEGRLCVTWILTSEIRNNERIRVEALNRITPYSESCDSRTFQMQDGEFRSLFRCACFAGDVPGLPKTWPKWSKSISAVRYE